MWVAAGAGRVGIATTGPSGYAAAGVSVGRYATASLTGIMIGTAAVGGNSRP